MFYCVTCMCIYRQKTVVRAEKHGMLIYLLPCTLYTVHCTQYILYSIVLRRTLNNMHGACLGMYILCEQNFHYNLDIFIILYTACIIVR